jgi:thiamine transport system substrate-binding protein
MRKFIEFMRGKDFQSALPEQMYVYPIDKGVALPADWKRFAPVASKPYAVDPDEVTKHRSTWLRQWRDLTSR